MVCDADWQRKILCCAAAARLKPKKCYFARPPEAAAGDAQAAAEARGAGGGAGPLRVEGRDQECDDGLHAGAGASDGVAASGWDLVFGPVNGSSTSVRAEADTGGCGLRNILSVFVRGVLCGGV